VANIGYIQVVRHCNHFCGFCSNPTTPYTHTFETMKVLVDDFVKRGYFGVILTGGEPSLHPELPRIARYATEQGLHVRMITNGARLCDAAFAEEMAAAGLRIVHVSVYSVRPEVEAQLRGMPGTLEKAFAAVENAHRYGIDVNINCVINKLNADHLDENIRHWMTHHPYIQHFVWNNLDPSMGRAEVNQSQYTPRLADFELSLHRALRLLQQSGRTFRVEKVPLCYMADGCAGDLPGGRDGRAGGRRVPRPRAAARRPRGGRVGRHVRAAVPAGARGAQRRRQRCGRAVVRLAHAHR